MRISQVPQAVVAHAWRESPIELRFSGRIDTRGGCRNRLGECGIVKWLVVLTRVHASIIALGPRQGTWDVVSAIHGGCVTTRRFITHPTVNPRRLP